MVRHTDLRQGLPRKLDESPPEFLASLTRRALLRIYSPEQAAIWLDAHATGDPVVVARKALRLCGIADTDGSSRC